jgi:integrase
METGVGQCPDLAMSEGLVTKNPATTLLQPVMTIQDVRKALAALELRERLVFKLAIAGLRPGKIFGLRRGLVVDHGIDIQQRVYRGLVDTPKTQRSMRSVALSKMLREDIEAWLAQVPGGPKGWVFPSEKLKTPMSKDNFMYRFLRPALRKIGLEWVSCQVMRRTHSTLMHQLKIDPKVVADLMGHDVNVNLNVYTQTSIEARL